MGGAKRIRSGTGGASRGIRARPLRSPGLPALEEVGDAMNKHNLASLLLLAGLCGTAPAQTIDASLGVDLPAVKTLIDVKVVGAPGATVTLFAALKLASTPMTLPWGTLYLDVATLTPVATTTLNGVGVGKFSVSLSAATFKSWAFDVQVAQLSGGKLTLSNYQLLGGWANSLSTEILAARYDPTTDWFQILGKGPSFALMELFRKPPLLVRERIGGITVPYASMAWGVGPCVFTPGDSLDVYVFGTTWILHVQ